MEAIKASNSALFKDVQEAAGDSSHGPGLAELDKKLHMVWKGIGNDQKIYQSSFGGKNWEGQAEVQNIGTSRVPGLTAHDGSLYMAWRGSGDNRIYYRSFAGNYTQRCIPGRGTSEGPSLASCGGSLYMAWKGDDRKVWWSSLKNESLEEGKRYGWSEQEKVPEIEGDRSPALASLGNTLYLAVIDGSRAKLTSFDTVKRKWSNKGMAPGDRWCAPTLAAYRDGLSVAATDTENNKKILYTRYVPGDGDGTWWDSCLEQEFDTECHWPALCADPGSSTRLYMVFQASSDLMRCWTVAG